MGVEAVASADIHYHLLAFDAEGRERPERDGPHSAAVLEEAAQTNPTDIFVFSHGWMGDVPAARRQYSAWLTAMVSCGEDRAAAHALPGGFSALLLGLHWPSMAWGDEDLGSASFDVPAPAPAEEPAPARADDAGNGAGSLIDEYAARLADTPGTRAALRTLVDAASRDAAPMTLPPDVRHAYEVIDAEAAMSAHGEGAAPGDDRQPFDPEATYQACQLAEVVSFGGPLLGGVLAPLRVLTFWHMKRRARTIGERAGASLLDALRQAAPAARVHVMGHSFGCIVASAAVAGGTGAPGARRPVQSLMLAQGAMSLWSFCSSIPSRPERPGYFHRVVADHLVTGPTLVTTSVHDRAVRTFYPIGAGARDQVDFVPGKLPTYGGIGTFGVRGSGIDLVDGELRSVSDAYDLRAGVVHNLRADNVIATSQGIMGAHSDIAQPAVAHALWQAVLTGPRA